MNSVGDVAKFLQAIAPLELAESWDNVGLLVGSADAPVGRVMTALTLVPENVQEAIEMAADIVVVHHPLPFHPLKRITAETTPGRMLLDLIRGGASVYSAHTAWDNTAGGINEQLANVIGLTSVGPMLLAKHPELAKKNLGSGRVGNLPQESTVEHVAHILQKTLAIETVSLVCDRQRSVSRVGIVCGSGGSLLALARETHCQLFITGEATFHQCLEAQSYGISLILLGHFASEKFGMNQLGNLISQQFPAIEVRSSRMESEPSGPLSR